jgi:hypothetical protein
LGRYGGGQGEGGGERHDSEFDGIHGSMVKIYLCFKDNLKIGRLKYQKVSTKKRVFINTFGQRLNSSGSRFWLKIRP